MEGPGKPRRISKKAPRELQRYFRALHNHFGSQHWWPARTRLEVILGAILTQNTSWRNVEIAVASLRRGGMLRLASLNAASENALAKRIRPSGFFRQKARAIRNFLAWLDDECEGSLNKLFSMPPEHAREGLLSIGGIGQETADAILLYAGNLPYFVADGYTRRVFIRHGLVKPNATYSSAQEFIHRHLERDYLLYNEYHALLVEVGKRYCVKFAPKCCDCPLRGYLRKGQPLG